MNEIRKGELRPGPALLLLIISDKVRDDIGVLYAGEREAAAWIGRSQPTYRKWRAELIEAGHLARLGAPRPNAACRWQVMPDPVKTPGLSRSGESTVEQPRKHGGAIEPQRTSPVFTEEKTEVHEVEFEPDVVEAARSYVVAMLGEVGA
jgi:hypothetical protein